MWKVWTGLHNPQLHPDINYNLIDIEIDFKYTQRFNWDINLIKVCTTQSSCLLRYIDAFALLYI
jgi:hypothetical protein